MGKQKMNLFKRAVASFVPKKYLELMRTSNGSMVGYVFVLILLIGGISTIGYIMQFNHELLKSTGAKNYKEFFEEKTPDFYFNNNELVLEKEVKYDEEGFFIYATDKIDEFTITDIEQIQDEEDYSGIVLFSKNNIAMYQADQGKYQLYKYSELQLGNLSKMEIYSVLKVYVYIIFLFVLLFVYLFKVAQYFFLALCYLAFGALIASIYKKRFTGAQLYKMAIYVKTPGFILSCIIGFLPITIPGILINMIYLLLTLVLLIFVISKLEPQELYMNNQYYQNIPNQYNPNQYNQNQYNPNQYNNVNQYYPNNQNQYNNQNMVYQGTNQVPDTEQIQMQRPIYNQNNSDVNPVNYSSNNTIRIKNVECKLEEIEIINTHVACNVKDIAIERLMKITGFDLEEATEVIENWKTYYKR